MFIKNIPSQLAFSIALASVLLGSKVFAFDHKYSDYEKLLNKYVIEKGSQTLVNYRQLKGGPELDSVLKSFSQVTKKEFKSWSKYQQLAFLINSYNSFTLKLIVDHYPVKSIKDIGSFFSSPWKKEFFNLLEEKSNLDHIEHELIRNNFKEPRIHFAVNCASMGCPALARVPYQADILDKQLDRAAKVFITNPERNKLEKGQNKIFVSKIFNWYGDDFQKMSGISYQKFIQNYLPEYQPQLHKVEWLNYDWSLNESP